HSSEPLAARMRPRNLDEFLGQERLLGPGKALGELIRRGDVASCIFWGPPGSGKTTLARIVANYTDRQFEPFSAVPEGVAKVRETLTPEHISQLVRRALEDKDRGLGTLRLAIEDDALALLAREADGDARRALQALEAAAEFIVGKAPPTAGPPHRLTAALISDALQKRFAKYDKGGEEHYNLISALHKAVRGSDVEGSLYWLARMLAGGEDPLYIARRLVRIASEDVGLADPRALSVTLAAKDAYHFLGSPEGELALAQATVYLATAPKSNRVYAAYDRAAQAAAEHPAEGVPLHIRNAPTPLMEELGYRAGYKYAHAYDHAYVPQEYLPEALRGQRWYEPTEYGFEKDIKKRLEWWQELTRKLRSGEEGGVPPDE